MSFNFSSDVFHQIKQVLSSNSDRKIIIMRLRLQERPKNCEDVIETTESLFGSNEIFVRLFV